MKGELSTKDQSEFHSVIDIKVSEFLLTPLSCASIINEILKTLLYQKAQIPYTYSWLKNIVDKKRRNSDHSEDTRKMNFTVMNHYRTVSTVYDALEGIMDSIAGELKSSNSLKEIIIVLGVTPLCPKEVYTIRIASVERGHSENNHMLETLRKQHKVLRNIFLSQTWMDSMDSSLSCTNTYVFLKKNSGETVPEGCADNIFIPSKPLMLSSKVKNTIINLSYDKTQEHVCCSNLKVFRDVQSNESPTKKTDAATVISDENDEDCDEYWSQSKVLIQGFKDCFINKVSACELW